jgi:integrase
MRAMPGLIQDRYGTYYVQRKVPDRLQEAVARVLNSGKSKQVFLKKSLGTKVLREANVAATHVLADFNRTLASAEALLKERPVVATLTDALIKRMAEWVYATTLKEDEALRFSGRLETTGQNGENVNADALWDIVQDCRQQFASGDVSFAEQRARNALAAFGITLDQSSTAFQNLCTESAKAFLKALDAIGHRYEGLVIETPRLHDSGALDGHGEGGTLKEAFEGWKKERERPEGTVHEYGRAVEMFIQLHGNLAIADIRRSHARAYRAALQLVPKIRKGGLLKASLPELSEYGRTHPAVAKVSPGTVNKQIGAVQAIAGWGHKELLSDDVVWADAFAEMRLEEEQSEREPFDARDLQTIFDAPLFAEHKLPAGAKGNAGVWLPLLALFAGARQAEYAGLRVSDIRSDEDANVLLMWFTRDVKAGRRLKTKTSERVVPIHPQLVTLGFLKYVETRRKDGDKAWLFPTVAPDQKGALSAWSKWWGRYLRNHVGINDRNKVYHSFRHGFQDALRRTTPDEELRDALTGRSSGGKSVGRTYGAKEMLRRWGANVLKRAVDDISYPGLDLSRVEPLSVPLRTRDNTKTTKGHRAHTGQ